MITASDDKRSVFFDKSCKTCKTEIRPRQYSKCCGEKWHWQVSLRDCG